VVGSGKQIDSLCRRAVQTHVLGQRAQAKTIAARCVLTVAFLEIQIGVKTTQANITLRTLDLHKK
jgi:hypothetical protein